MGDYARSAINTSFNTGTVVGVGPNVFGKGLTPKFIPNFSWVLIMLIDMNSFAR
jgi:hypothetical protein